MIGWPLTRRQSVAGIGSNQHRIIHTDPATVEQNQVDRVLNCDVGLSKSSAWQQENPGSPGLARVQASWKPALMKLPYVAELERR